MVYWLRAFAGLQETQVWLPVPTPESSEPFVTPLPWDLMPFSSFFSDCRTHGVRTDRQAYTNTNTKFKSVLRIEGGTREMVPVVKSVDSFCRGMGLIPSTQTVQFTMACSSRTPAPERFNVSGL